MCLISPHTGSRIQIQSTYNVSHTTSNAYIVDSWHIHCSYTEAENVCLNSEGFPQIAQATLTRCQDQAPAHAKRGNRGGGGEGGRSASAAQLHICETRQRAASPLSAPVKMLLSQ